MASTPERIAAERAVLARRLQRASGELTTWAVARMETTLPWFAALPARDRAAVGELAQLGVRTFVDWFTTEGADREHTERIFTRAPRELAQSLSLEQTVELVRTSISVVEESVARIAGDNQLRQAQLRESLLRYSSEVAFAAANVYARLAETRGAWDARLQSMLLDTILRGDVDGALDARAAAAGWRVHGRIFTLVGAASASRQADEVHAAQLQRTAQHAGLDALVGVHSDHIVAVIAGLPDGADVRETAAAFVGHFGPGTVVAGPAVDGLSLAHTSAASALSAFRALPLVNAPGRLVTDDEVIAARILNGDEAACAPTIAALTGLRPDVRDTLACYLERATSIESCARLLFVHVNTVRYRLRQVEQVTGLDPAAPDDALTLRMGLMLGRKSALL